MMVIIDFLLAGLFLTGILIKPSICPWPSTPKCLKYLHEAREKLSSKIPPIKDSNMTDNYYNISRALFPSVDLPTLYVRVTIQFLKVCQNETKMIDDQKKKLKFTWSKACSYVSVKHLSLDAMTVFSLATIFPQRRESELVMTVQPFCPNSPYATDNKKESNTWRYVVSTLEDIVISPYVSDPRLNTVSCVINGHEGDIDEYSNLSFYFYWFILVTSFCASISLWIFLLQCLIDGMKKDKSESTRRVAGAALKMTHPISVLIMFVAAVISVATLTCLKSKANCKMHLYYIVYIVLYILSFIIGCGFLKCRSAKDQKTYKFRAGSYSLLPCLFQLVHHFLWVVCGIISDPFWAIPIFLLECLFAVSILFAFFLYEKEFEDSSQGDSDSFEVSDLLGNKLIKVHLVVCWVSFVLVLITIALIAVNNGNAVNSPTAGALEGAMTVILIWLVKNSRLDSVWKKKKKNGNSDVTGSEPSVGELENGKSKSKKNGKGKKKKNCNTTKV